MPHRPSARLPSQPRDLKPEHLRYIDRESADPLARLRLREAVRGRRDIDPRQVRDDIEQFDGF
jgi:hypothetical protein